MPLFTVDIEKTLDGEFWTNRYIIDEIDIQSANQFGLFIVNRERDIHSTSITFSRYRTSDQIPLNDSFVVTPIGENGLRDTGFSLLLPLFNCVRVDFGVAFGRPSRKYLRIGLTESDVSGADIVSTVVDLVGTIYADALVSDPTFVDVDGQAISSRSVFEKIQMRQLRRGSRRRTQPIL